MSASHFFWFFAGLLVGVGHAASLWRSAARVDRFAAVAAIVRLGLVAAALVVAAIAAVILAVASGWAIGFAVAAVVLVGRPPAVSKPRRGETGSRKEKTDGIPSLR